MTLLSRRCEGVIDERCCEGSLKTLPELFDRFHSNTDPQQPAADAALFNKVQLCVMRQDCVRTAQSKICTQIGAFADFQTIEHDWRRR